MLPKKVSIILICTMLSLLCITPVYASIGWSTNPTDLSGGIRINVNNAVPASIHGAVYLDVYGDASDGEHLKYIIDDPTIPFTKDIGFDLYNKMSQDRLRVVGNDRFHASVTVDGAVVDSSDTNFEAFNTPGTDVFIHNALRDTVTVSVYDDQNRQVDRTQSLKGYDDNDKLRSFLPVSRGGTYRVVVEHGGASAETNIVTQTMTIYDDITGSFKYTSINNQQAFFEVTNNAVTVSTPPSSQYTKVPVDSSVFVYDTASASWVQPDGVIPDVWYRADANGNITSSLVQLQLKNLFHEPSKDDITMPTKYKASTFKIVARFGSQNYVPTVLFGRNLDTSFDSTDGMSNGWTFDATHKELTVYAKPSSLAVGPDGGGPIAVHHHEDSVLLASGALGAYTPDHTFQLNDDSTQTINRGVTVSTNAESYSMPNYVKAGSGMRPHLEVTVGGPTYMEDGITKNLGYFQIYLPPTLLNEWGIHTTGQLLAAIGDGKENQNAKDILFEATGDKTTGITLIIRNHGYSTHTFTISSKPDETDVPPADTNTIVVPLTPSVPTKETEMKEESGGVKMGEGSTVVTNETTSDGKVVSKVTLDTASLTKAFDLLKNKDKNSQQITIPVSDTNKVNKVALPMTVLADAAGTLSAPVISVASASASYQLPIKELNLTALAAKLGANANDISVNITMEQVVGSLADQIASTASKANVTMLAAPVDFSLSVEANGKKEEISSFNSYVSRSLQLADTVDPLTTTGVLCNPETGTMTFVPTVFSTANGKSQATLLRKGNSIYTIVKSNKTFDDLAGHWGKADIELLASKLVIQGVTDKQFMPEDKITRAQFATLVVRALGLTENIQVSFAFQDVSAGSWYAGAVGAAVQAGLIEGFEDRTFKPEQTITREQMAVLVARAVKAADKSVNVDGKQEQLLGKYTDRTSIAAWAQASVAEAADAGIMQGLTKTEFAPSRIATRAEAAKVLKLLLQNVGFMN